MPTFPQVSLNRLDRVHPDLKRLMVEAIKGSPVPFIITEGFRTRERQAEMVRSGASQTTNSRHLTGHAVDVACLVGTQVRWDWPLYVRLSVHIKATAERLWPGEGDDRMDWGGDWKTLRDGPHYELTWKRYPK